MAGETTDGYLRLIPEKGATPQLDMRPTRPGGLTFVDIDTDARPSAGNPDPGKVIDAFAGLQQRITGSDNVLLIRWPRTVGRETGDSGDHPSHAPGALEWIEEIAAASDRVAMHQSYTGALVFQLGEEPRILWAQDEAPPDSQQDLAQRARAVELLAMLRRGDAIWEPSNYHYRLPSGAHDTVFVRIADAFRSTRDCSAIATWLTRHEIAAHDGVGVLVDTGTLAPVVTAFQSLQRQHDVRPGPMATLDEYPRTRLEVRRVARLAGGSGAVLGVLSVSSSGSVQGAMVDSLEHTSPGAWTLDTLADRKLERWPSRDYGFGVQTWLTRTEMGIGPLPGNRCRACERNPQARLVQIHPRSFEALTLAEPELRMPDTASAQDNATWWRLVADNKAIGVECAPHQQVQAARSAGGRMAVRVFLDRALRDQSVGAAITGRIKAINRRESRAHDLIADRLKEMRGADTFLVSEPDRELFEMHAATLRKALSAPKAALVSESQLAESGAAAVGRKVVVLLAGTVTGTTSTRLRMALATDPEPELHGLVLHARPTGPDEWRHIRNTFKRKLVALWLTYLPERSPLRDEAYTLGEWESSWSDLTEAEQAFVADRVAYCRGGAADWDDRLADYQAAAPFDTYANLYEQQQAGEGDCPPPPEGLLWGQPPRGKGMAELRGHPLYGAKLDPLTYYAAVGAAVQSSLLTNRAVAAPQWVMFDMPGICRSYFDGPLIACILRWVEPQRAWWGGRQSQAERAMETLLARHAPNKADMLVLLPELLLAAAQGKVHPSAQVILLKSIDEIVRDWDYEERVPVEVGRKLVAFAHARKTDTPTEAE